jgi:hypothetical protein
MAVTFLMKYAKSAGLYAEPQGMHRFTDIPAGIWYEDAVNWAVYNGITTGYGQGTFQPTVPCTRAMMVTFLVRMPE